jgi:hypothetical protein
MVLLEDCIKRDRIETRLSVDNLHFALCIDNVCQLLLSLTREPSYKICCIPRVVDQLAPLSDRELLYLKHSPRRKGLFS